MTKSQHYGYYRYRYRTPDIGLWPGNHQNCDKYNVHNAVIVYRHFCFTITNISRRWFGGSVLAFGTQVRGFNPGRSRRIIRAKKILSAPSFGEEVKPSVLCRKITACKRTQK